MKTRPILAIVLLASLMVVSVVPCAQAAADRIVLPTQVRPLHYDIAFTPDAAQMSFTGTARIDIEVSRPTRSIVLNAVDLSFDKVMLDDKRAASAVAFDTERQTATLRFATEVGAGRHFLAISYTGKINQHPAGLFALDYDAAQGKKRALFTQFENSDARRFMPSWDEPALKATFTLTATVPAGEMAVSNMPVDASTMLPDGLQRVRFAESPKMSSYLLFFAAGDFERLSQNVNGVDVGVVVKRGDTEKARFALDAATHLLPYYEDYFGVKYPQPKLDLIAGPGQSQFFGAMENWGAIFYFESDLLVDPALSTQGDRREVYIVVAHEMAHQWFGDLVTMSWWDDLWLNEGFASWMENKATDHFHPEWTLWLEAQSDKERAMRLDARRGTHPIIQPIRDVLQANEAFDSITYQKGEAVIRMLENFVGEEKFRDGVRSYIKAHAYGNTVTDDLWRELDKTSATPVSAIAHDFTLQGGSAAGAGGANAAGIRLTQSRFAVDASGRTPARWQVPVAARPLDSTTLWHGLLLPAKPSGIAGTGGTLVNAGQAGYFRTLYAPAALRPLVAGFRSLAAADELGLLDDSLALGYSGYAPLSDFLELAGQGTPDMDPVVLTTLVRSLEDIDFRYEGLPGQARFRAFGRGLLQPVFARLGWNASPGESQNTTLLRAALLDALSEFEDAEVIGAARTQFAGYLHDSSTLSGDRRRSVLAVVAEHADSDTWEQLHRLAKNAPSSLEKERLYGLLGTVHDRELADRAMQLTLSDEIVVSSRPELISGVSHYYPDLAFAFVTAHLDQVMQVLEPDSRNEFLPRIVSSSHELAMIQSLRAYAAAHIPPSARQSVVKAEAVIAYNADVRQRRLPDIDRWLQLRHESQTAAPPESVFP